jgi:hypothetical protein
MRYSLIAMYQMYDRGIYVQVYKKNAGINLLFPDASQQDVNKQSRKVVNDQEQLPKIEPEKRIIEYQSFTGRP